MEEATISVVNEKIEVLTKLVEGMKEFIEDSFLTAEEEISLEKNLEEFRKGDVCSLEDVKQELNV